MAKVTYHKSHTFTDKEGAEHIFLTQLYQVGVYAILDNDPGAQFNFTPQQIKKLEKNLKKAEQEGDIKELQFGAPITVSDETGLWKEWKE